MPPPLPSVRGCSGLKPCDCREQAPGARVGGTGGGLLHIVVQALDYIDVDHLKKIRSKFQLLNIAAF
jgi:hypothetical protein